jgi:hypothetical protein
MLKLKIIYRPHVGRDPEVIESSAQRVDGEWMQFATGDGLQLLVRTADIERVERAA